MLDLIRLLIISSLLYDFKFPVFASQADNQPVIVWRIWFYCLELYRAGKQESTIYTKESSD